MCQSDSQIVYVVCVTGAIFLSFLRNRTVTLRWKDGNIVTTLVLTSAIFQRRTMPPPALFRLGLNPHTDYTTTFVGTVKLEANFMSIPLITSLSH